MVDADRRDSTGFWTLHMHHVLLIEDFTVGK